MRTKNYPPKKDSEENRSYAFNRSLRYLTIRARSIKELHDYLIRKNYQEKTIDIVIKRLIDLKFLNDEDFGRQWTESRQKNKGKSKFLIKMELKQKGLNNNLIDEIVAEADDDINTARKIYEIKKNKLKGLTSQEFKKKMAGFLGRKGYSWDVISKLIEKD